MTGSPVSEAEAAVGTGDGCGLLKYEPPLIRSEGIKGEDKYAESIEGGRE